MFPRIFIQNGSVKKIPEKVKTLGSSFAIITDKNLTAQGQAMRKALQKAGLVTHLLLLPPGEKTKSLSLLEKVASSLLKFGLKRDSCLIALGGGVIGDLTGFCASIYMRGISYIAVPTTLLSMGDSSIGGKTGIDLSEGKNLLGTFYHPRLIIMDPLLLKTVPERDFRNGLAEIVKHAVIADLQFFKFLEKNVSAILGRTPAVLQKIVKESVRIKSFIVKKDEKESIKKTKGVSRMFVNYGHTVGHALEKLSNYTLPHGEAVAIGMAAENRLAVGKKILKQTDADRISALLEKFRLPVTLPSNYSSSQLEKAMSMDKKTIGGKLYFALPKRIGAVRLFTL